MTADHAHDTFRSLSWEEEKNERRSESLDGIFNNTEIHVRTGPIDITETARRALRGSLHQKVEMAPVTQLHGERTGETHSPIVETAVELPIDQLIDGTYDFEQEVERRLLEAKEKFYEMDAKSLVPAVVVAERWAEREEEARAQIVDRLKQEGML